jgi:hypothetical protein
MGDAVHVYRPEISSKRYHGKQSTLAYSVARVIVLHGLLPVVSDQFREIVESNKAHVFHLDVLLDRVDLSEIDPGCRTKTYSWICGIYANWVLIHPNLPRHQGGTRIGGENDRMLLWIHPWFGCPSASICCHRTFMKSEPRLVQMFPLNSPC